MNSDTKTLQLPLGKVDVKTSTKPFSGKPLTVAGLFAGIGGVERGLERSGHHAEILCEIDEGAKAVLRRRFSGMPIHDDVRTLKALPRGIDLLTGGFPCQDLSQAGKAEGILRGSRSGLVTEVFRLVQKSNPKWVLLENVPFMLRLDSGRAMGLLADAFELLGYKWAYRVVNSQAFGVPQRRERVIFLASQDDDPRQVLLADNADEPIYESDQVGKAACGFYWTEGLRGLGWAVNAVPTLKGGSSIGIPSPPAIVFPNGRIATPDIRDAERMQGFPSDWTKASSDVARESHRWTLVGNAVTVGVFDWVGRRLLKPSVAGAKREGYPKGASSPWTDAGWNVGSGRYSTSVSRFPRAPKEIDLATWLKYPCKPLSERATAGFLSRTKRAKLRFPPDFINYIQKHLDQVRATGS